MCVCTMRAQHAATEEGCIALGGNLEIIMTQKNENNLKAAQLTSDLDGSSRHWRDTPDTRGGSPGSVSCWLWRL